MITIKETVEMIKFLLPYTGYIIPPIVTFYLGVYTERNFKKNFYQKNLFDKISKIVSDEQLIQIIDEAGTCYLRTDTLTICEKLSTFIRNPANIFLNEKLNKAFLQLQESFTNLCTLFATDGDHVGSGDILKLVVDKTGKPEERRQLINKCKELTLQLEKSHKNFRTLIRDKLYI